MKDGQHIVSLSLGNVAEPSAVAVIDPRTQFKKGDRENHFNVNGLKRFPAGCPIPVIVNLVNEWMSGERLAKNCRLLIDTTSTGKAPLRVFENSGLYATRIDLTDTNSEVSDVIGAAQIVVQTNRLKVASGLKLAATLVSDLLSFDPKPAARGLDLRGGRNSDLVLALAVALWWADDLTWGIDPDVEKHRPRAYTGPGGWMG